DYLKWQYAGWDATQSGHVDGNTYYLTIKYTMTWYTTEKQETALDVRINRILQSLNLDGKSDYEKISAIYSYVCQHVTYDSKHDADDSYKLKYTAYAAVINGTSVCQGYSVFLYRLLLEEGIDCRFISGTANGENHSWNIVKLGGKYYNLDATWDAGSDTPAYFLKSDANFSDHERDEAYLTQSFARNYPMGDTDYDEQRETHTHTYKQPEFEWSSDLLSCIARFFCTLGDDIQQEACTVTVNEDGTRIASCTFDGKTYTDQIISDTRRVEDIFTDVPATSWYRDFVQYVYDHALMGGVSKTEFRPNGTLTRAQVVQILYNQAGSPDVTGESRFTDVKSTAWYYRAVTWAAENHIVGGYTDGTFRPNQSITRQEVAVMLYSRAGRPAVSGSLDGVFADSSAVAGWAKNAMVWAYQNQILSGERVGDNLYLRPANHATRAQAAVMITRYAELAA
uniref:S-layer homology domain-containing protein n=1 Tax=Butyricicoccus sp. TaxID=2049021 RepID=UPI003D7EF932